MVPGGFLTVPFTPPSPPEKTSARKVPFIVSFAVKDQEDYSRYYQPIPCWIPNHEFTAPAEYDMWACNWKTNFMPFGIGNNQENAWLAELREEAPCELYMDKCQHGKAEGT